MKNKVMPHPSRILVNGVTLCQSHLDFLVGRNIYGMTITCSYFSRRSAREVAKYLRRQSRYKSYRIQAVKGRCECCANRVRRESLS
ncbi:hypothetical protein LCGC14_2562840 [marine sediment metagenome]|uniref:Uncharacterized protein n=1 Tax=marine sediment metagenome TaxID=412755 RepID=A0A0F9B7I6_9ZZZZ